jgi:hypothetical protein
VPWVDAVFSSGVVSETLLEVLPTVMQFKSFQFEKCASELLRVSVLRHNITVNVQRFCESSCCCYFHGDTALQVRRSRFRFPMVSLEFLMDIIIPVALWPWVDSASNRNEYHGYFLRVKAAGA